MAETKPDLWIFGYGSLMWRPDFPFAARHRAMIVGYRRSLCIHSHIYRGTPDRPGLVFGLDSGGSCEGVAFLIAPAVRDAVLEAVRRRELVTSVYKELEAPIALDDGRSVVCVTYVADHTHEQYAGALPLAAVRQIVRGAEGIAGSNLEYVLNTHGHLRGLGIDDQDLSRLCDTLENDAAAEA